MSQELIVVLGYKNEPTGTLHPIAVQRSNKALEIARNSNARLMCTGGFGENFNQSSQPHGTHVQNYLEANGICRSRFLPHVPSTNTAEDGLSGTGIITANSTEKQMFTTIHLVTSDFHIKRGFLWFRRCLPQHEIICYPAQTIASTADMTSLLAHEEKAIAIFYEDFPDTPPLQEVYPWGELGL